MVAIFSAFIGKIGRNRRRSNQTMKKLIIYLGGICIIIGFNVWWNYVGKPGEADRISSDDINNAYTAAQAYFTDYPSGRVTLTRLTAYGFVPSKSVTMNILSGKRSDLKITAVHKNGTQIYIIRENGQISFKNFRPMSKR